MTGIRKFCSILKKEKTLLSAVNYWSRSKSDKTTSENDVERKINMRNARENKNRRELANSNCLKLISKAILHKLSQKIASETTDSCENRSET